MNVGIEDFVGAREDRRGRDYVLSQGSYWQRCGGDVPFAADRNVPERADFVVIGGGFAGIATAIRLKEMRPEASVLVLEAQFVGYGASGRNGGLMSPIPAPVWLMTAGHSADHAWALRHINEEVAGVASWLGAVAPEGEVRAETLRIEATGLMTACALEKVSAILEDVGLAHEVTMPGAGGRKALEMPAHTVHPFKLVQSLATYAQRLGVMICEGVPVAEIARVADDAVVGLVGGDKVEAHRVIVSTNAYTTKEMIGEVVPAKVVHNYMIATDCDHGSADAGALPFVVELNKAYVFYRAHAGRLVYGGIEKFKASGGGAFDVPVKIFDGLKKLMRRSFGFEKLPRISDAWGGQFHMTSTDLPVIRVSENNPAVALNIGYGGTGVALTLLCSRMAAAVALGGAFQSDADRRLYDIMAATRPPVAGAFRFGVGIAWRVAKAVFSGTSRSSKAV